MTNEQSNALATPSEVAEYLQIKEGTLAEWRYRKTGQLTSGFGVNAFWRQGPGRSFGFERWSRRCLDPRRTRSAVISHAPDATRLIVGDVKSAVGPDRQT